MSSSLENVSTSVNIQNFSTTKEIPFDYIQDLSLVIDATTTQISHSQVLNFTTVLHIPNIATLYNLQPLCLLFRLY